MADHGTVEYATAESNDYPAHEHGYESFVFFTFTGILTVVNILLCLAVGGVMGHWFVMVVMFIITAGGAIPGLLGGSKTSSYVAFVLNFLIFVFSAL
jgi:uncharacterized membrane protein